MRRRFLAEIKQRRNPHERDHRQLLDRYLDQHQGGKSTVSGYREYVDKQVRPFIGKTKIGDIDADILDSLYAELRAAATTARSVAKSTTALLGHMNATSGAVHTVAKF